MLFHDHVVRANPRLRQERIEEAAAVAELSRAGIGIATFSLGQPTIDEVFLALTGHPAEQNEATNDSTAVERSAA